MASALQQPDSTEFPPYFGKYVQLVEGTDILAILSEQIAAALTRLRAIDDRKASTTYEPGKWTIKEVVGHLTDAERVFAYRALRFGRGDTTPLPSFEQDIYVTNGGFDACSWAGLLEEFELVRKSTILLLRHFPPEAWTRRGVASGKEITVRALAYVIAGHEIHHMRILADRYGV